MRQKLIIMSLQSIFEQNHGNCLSAARNISSGRPRFGFVKKIINQCEHHCLLAPLNQQRQIHKNFRATVAVWNEALLLQSRLSTALLEAERDKTHKLRTGIISKKHSVCDWKPKFKPNDDDSKISRCSGRTRFTDKNRNSQASSLIK